MPKTIELEIAETCRNSLNEEPARFNTIHETFETTDLLKKYLIHRYGKMPKGRKKIYRDCKDAQPIEVGCLHSFWNKDDWSHNSRKWYQTDWIEFYEQHTEINYFKLQC
jgi:hypothetical protein